MKGSLDTRMKYASLCCLSLQTATHVVVTRYSRVTSQQNPYLVSTVVAMVEVFKILMCTFIHFCEKGFSIPETCKSIYEGIFQKPLETVKLIVPAALYVVQNSLLFVALSNLDSATYQVCYQLKILTTAMFSVIMLQRRLQITQWLSLVILSAGVALVQVSKSGSSKATADATSSAYIGLLTILAASCLSGFNGVYFEKVLKGSSQSLWIKNIQLAGFSIIIAFATVYFGDGQAVMDRGFFQGYTWATWAVIALGVLSGLTVALVVKYADNILKGFAVSISILLSTFVSFYFLNDFEPSVGFFCGAFLVIIATFLYGMDFTKKKTL